MNDFMIFEAGELEWTGASAERIGTFTVVRTALNLRNVISFALDESDGVIGIQTPNHYYHVISEEKQAALRRWLLINQYREVHITI